jgi:hypothetical protein
MAKDRQLNSQEQTTQWPRTDNAMAKNRKLNGQEQTTQWPNKKGQITIHKTLHRKLKIKQQETNRERFVI